MYAAPKKGQIVGMTQSFKKSLQIISQGWAQVMLLAIYYWMNTAQDLSFCSS